MYVVDELEELVLKGLPQKLRGHLWMVLSGAENDVSLLKYISKCYFIECLTSW